MADLRLTDLTQATGVTFDDLIHIVITGDTTQYSGGSSYKATVNQVFDSLSGYCLSDLNVTNIHSCSPLNINPLDEGEVYFGSTSGITLDVTNKRIGINTSAPQYTLDIKGGQSNLYYDPTSVGGRLAISGSTNVPRFNVEVPPYLTKLQATMSIGVRAWDDTLYPDYGNLGDAHLYAGVNAYGLNIISEYGVNSEDYIRFYAGQDASSGNTPDIHIQGSGSTRGYVGIGTSSPTEKLEVSSGDMLVENTNGKYYTDIQNTTGPLTILSGNSSGVSRIGVVVPTYDSVTLGVRGPSAGFPGYGKQGDAFIYSSSPNNGFNLISAPGTGTEDYIRFYAGQTANGTTPDIHIQGSGSTRGYVGIGTESPTEKLHISGNTKIDGSLSATTISATTFTGTSTTMSGTKGTTVLNGSTTTAFLTFSGSNTVGGTGYTDFIRVTNTAVGATTPNKTFRLDSAGSFHIINNAYSSTLFDLTDSGNLTVTGRVKSSVNYSQTGGGASVTLGASITPQTILSLSITTYGNPVMICAYGDAENLNTGYWSRLQFWRDSTAIGAIVHTEGSAASENSPFALTYIDAPAAGTYTYYLKANEINGGSIKFGESTAPILNAREL